VKRELRSFISHSNIPGSHAGDLKAGAVEASLLTEYAARSLLTRQTVAYRYSKGLALDFNLKLAARA
jgi:hypothetical protein